MTEYLNPYKVKENLATTPQITFEVTERCCLNCTYCAYGELYSDYDQRHDRQLSYACAIKFLSFIKEIWEEGYDTNGKSEIDIGFYGGEPLMNMELIQKVVEYVESDLSGYGKTFSFSMTTNAIFLPKYMDYLVDKRFKLLISLDGDKEGNSYRVFKNGTPAFGEIVKSIELIKNKYPEYYEKFVDFNAVLNNKNSISGVRDYITNTFQKVPRLSEISMTGVRKSKQEEFDKIFQKTNESINSLSSQSSDFQKHPSYEAVASYLSMNSPYFFLDYNELLFGKRECKPIPTGTCQPFTKRVFVTVAGKILPCEKISHQYGLGQVREDGVEIDFEKIANTYNNYYNRITKLCSKCENKGNCLTCIFHNGYLENCRCNDFATPQITGKEKEAALLFFQQFPEAYSHIMHNLEVI